MILAGIGREEEVTMSGYTPGPWDCHTFLPESYKVAPHGESPLTWRTETPGEMFANARLIAKAPEMYEALQKIAAMKPPLDAESPKHYQAHLYHEMRKIAKTLLETVEE